MIKFYLMATISPNFFSFFISNIIRRVDTPALYINYQKG